MFNWASNLNIWDLTVLSPPPCIFPSATNDVPNSELLDSQWDFACFQVFTSRITSIPYIQWSEISFTKDKAQHFQWQHSNFSFHLLCLFVRSAWIFEFKPWILLLSSLSLRKCLLKIFESFLIL